MERKITEVTRRSIADEIELQKINWSGRFDEPRFLERLYDLHSMSSSDRRYNDAYHDIEKHRIFNSDWENNWVFYDKRFDLLGTGDDEFLRFLAEMIHPVVRGDAKEVEEIRTMLNRYLAVDGYHLVETTRISGKPIFAAKLISRHITALEATKHVVKGLNSEYVADQITRMETAIEQDPPLAIGTAKELIETCCKTVLDEHGQEYSDSDDLPKLMKKTAKALSLAPEDIPDSAKGAETIRRLLSTLSSLVYGLAELRNLYGTGHGRGSKSKGLQPRHAKLAVGAASSLAVFLLETHDHRSKS